MKMIKKGIIVGININNKNNFDESMEELKNLCLGSVGFWEFLFGLRLFWGAVQQKLMFRSAVPLWFLALPVQ